MRKKRKDYLNCIKCGSEKKADQQVYCSECRKTYYGNQKSNLKRKLADKEEIEGTLESFVKTIIERDYCASIEEINQIITYYNYFSKRNYEYDLLPPSKQIEKMWLEIKSKVSLT